MKTITIDGIEYEQKKSSLAENYVIVRTARAGAHAGELISQEGSTVKLKNARRIYYWDGAATLSELAMEGTSAPGNCKFPCEVPSIHLTDALETIPCTEKAEKSIKGVKVWTAHK